MEVTTEDNNKIKAMTNHKLEQLKWRSNHNQTTTTSITFLEERKTRRWSRRLVDFSFILENMEEIPEIITKKLSKKKSILRKDSLLDGSLLGWKTEKKKSVLFKTGWFFSKFLTTAVFVFGFNGLISNLRISKATIYLKAHCIKRYKSDQ